MVMVISYKQLITVYSNQEKQRKENIRWNDKIRQSDRVIDLQNRRIGTNKIKGNLTEGAWKM
jgi:hypothetical protein